MRLAAIFSDHMILQREKEIRVFGEAESGNRIRVEIDGMSAEAVAEDGRFVVRLPKHGAGGPYTMTVEEIPRASGKESATENDRQVKTFQDVFFGEVWIDNGQRPFLSRKKV